MHGSVLLTFLVVQTFHIGGTGGWDYLTVDAEHGLLYAPRTTHTQVIDAKTGKLVADIPGQKQNHGVAIVHSAGRGFISDGGDASVVIFDLKTNQVLGKVKADDDADGIIYDPHSKKVLVVCGDAGKLFPISPDVDPTSGNADPAIDLGGKPEFLAVDEGRIYINLVDKNQVAVVDSKTMKVIDKWPTAPGGNPVGMAIDPAKHRLFVGCRNPQKLIVMSTETGKVLGDLPIGAGVDATAFFDGYAFASCRDGTLAVAHETAPGKFEIAQTVTTKPVAKTMGVDPKTKSIYLPTAEFSNQKDARGRPSPKPDSFIILVVRPKPADSTGAASGQVHGRVMVDGNPLPQAKVTFRPVGNGPVLTGETDKNGDYQMSPTVDSTGKYRIQIIRPANGDHKSETVPKKYNTASTLMCEVKSGKNEINFEPSSR